MTVGERIKLRRLELKLSQSELAKKAGYSDKSAISKLEHSENDITLKQVKRIADALDVSPSFLIGWETSLVDYLVDDPTLSPTEKIMIELESLYIRNDLYKDLFKAAEGNSPENIQLAIDMLIRLKGK